MSNITLFTSGSVALPDYLKGSDELTKSLAGNGGGGKQISIKGGVWRMIVGGEEVAKNEDRAMNFVIVAASKHVHRTFYMGKFEEGKSVDPTCWSDDGKAPHADVPAAQRQCATCEKCPQNIEGSGEGKSRACRFSRRLAVALEGDLNGGIYRLQLPAKSIFGKPEGDKMPLDAYAKFLSGHNVPVSGVVTEARFDTNEAVPVLKFRAVRPLSREDFELVKQLATSDEANRAVELKIVLRKDKEAPAAAEYKEPAPKAVFTPTPKAEASAEAAVEEPVRRPKKPAVAAPSEDRVKDILSDWGSDDDEE